MLLKALFFPMKNSFRKMPKLLFSLFLFLFLCLKTKSAPNYAGIHCPNGTVYSPNSTYQANLNSLFASLSSNSTNLNGFYNSTAGGSSPPDMAYGLFLCRGDLSPDVCQDCVTTAVKDVVERCPESKVVTIWYDECMLRYSNKSIISIEDHNIGVLMANTQNASNQTLLREVLGSVMDDIATRASSGTSSKKFAVGQGNYLSPQKLYGLGQCTPDLRNLDCNTCLSAGISAISRDAVEGARMLFPSCVVRYELYEFYNSTGVPSPPPPILPPPATTSGSGGISTQLLIAIIVPISVSVSVFIIGYYCFLRRKSKKKYEVVTEDSVGNEMTTVESLQYSLAKIQAVTNNFSDENKIGEGGFGGVYKGTLPNGQEVAVKRLSRYSGQGAEEFKNEVVLVAKLQHRNLVRLLGFCLEGEEKILIYEFVPNKSLDKFLFDPQEQDKLDWSRRYKIIGGIARGMLYLHEDSRLRIIHRDLKASNILLDEDMNAKISDFGMARIFGVDQTQGNTSRVVGTFGYMSPEYVRHGQYSVKSDVFSFGVLLLEIISGKKNTTFHQSDYGDDLLTYAWKLWREGRPLELMDPILGGGSYSSNEVIRCIHIALLCVQEDANARPPMANVVLILNSYSTTLPAPPKPGFYASNEIGLTFREDMESDQSTSKSIPLSVNEVSVTELDPR